MEVGGSSATLSVLVSVKDTTALLVPIASAQRIKVRCHLTVSCFSVVYLS